MNRLVITKMEIPEKIPCNVCAVCEEGRVMELLVSPEEGTSLLNNIYVGQVEKINSNIQAAFILIQPGIRCYFPLHEAQGLIYASGKEQDRPLRPGDLVLVQVSREAMKQKLPSVTSNLTFTGKYLVLTSGNRTLGISQKLTSQERERLSGWLQDHGKGRDYGIVVRTNAKEASLEELEQELDRLGETFRFVKTQGPNRTLYSCIYKAASSAMQAVRDTRDVGEIVTDLPEVCRELEEQGCAVPVRLYQDSLLPLWKLYSLGSALAEALNRKVWLPSGGFLVIEQTEAFAAIDVNTGKCLTGKNPEETFRRINLEAAREIARQLRLRNLSGMILIDFINMKEPSWEEELFQAFSGYLYRDPVKCKAVDITALHILEMTRRKVRRSLAEEIQNIRDN